MKDYLTFRCVKDTGKTKAFGVYNISGDTLLGEVRWYAPWRRYCFFPHVATIFDVNCLREVISFINVEMAKRKAA